MIFFFKILILITFFTQANYIKYSLASTHSITEDFNVYNKNQVKALVKTVFLHNKKDTPSLETSNIVVKNFMEHVKVLIENANGEELYKLFYQPDWEIWSKLYNNITHQTASGIKIVELLDQTKTAILLAYKGKKIDGENANFYISSLIDEAIFNIFSGCWGIDDKPVESSLQKKLLGILDRTLDSRIAYEKQFTEDNEQFNFNKYKQDNSPKTFIDHVKALEQRWKFVAHNPTSTRQPIGNVDEMFLLSPKRTITFFTYRCRWKPDEYSYSQNIYDGFVADLIIELLAFSQDLPRAFIFEIQVKELTSDQKKKACDAIKKNSFLEKADKNRLISTLGFYYIHKSYD